MLVQHGLLLMTFCRLPLNDGINLAPPPTLRHGANLSQNRKPVYVNRASAECSARPLFNVDFNYA